MPRREAHEQLDVSRLIETDENQVISRIILVAGHPHQHINHWYIYFEVEERFVRLNMSAAWVPGQPGRKKGKLIVDSVDYNALTSGVRRESFYIRGQPTVGDLLDLVQQNRREYYVYTDTGQGCRHWCRTVLDDFLEAGVIKRKEYSKGVAALQNLWNASGNGTPREIQRGVFE
ncbi:hypothetical protein TWF506_005149 [Arthrobotrys conoides]|uniref:DUF7770 domain-containing protein n=1 Tax=Arthrobotrys conoides TaxID=74498 RepID=A0AAN8NTJ6_9PEZI